MTQIRTREDLEKVLRTDTIIPYNLDMNDRPTLFFACGCGEQHKVASSDVIPVLAGYPLKVLFRCKNGSYTYVHIKGFFIVKAVPLWTCPSDLVEHEDEEEPYTVTLGPEKWITFHPRTKIEKMLALQEIAGRQL